MVIMILTLILCIIVGGAGLLIYRYLINNKSTNEKCKNLGFTLWGVIIAICAPLTNEKVLKVDQLSRDWNSFSYVQLIENLDCQLWLFYGAISFVCIFIAGLVFAELPRHPEIFSEGNKKDEAENKEKEVKIEKITITTTNYTTPSSVKSAK